MENKIDKSNTLRNRIEEAIAFRKECLEKGISLRDAMKASRFNKLNQKQ